MTPLNDVNFGALIVGLRKSTTFTLENRGQFEFKYCISKRIVDGTKMRTYVVSPYVVIMYIAGRANLLVPSGKRNKNDLGSSSRSSSVISKLGTANKTKDASLRLMTSHDIIITLYRYEVLGGGSQRLVAGMFSLAPATGVIAPGQCQVITIDCIAERQGKHEEVC